jgi:outer membrane translocation and assembly module TamA
MASVGDLRLGALRAASGAGLRVQTPFDLLRIDMGAPLASRPGESRARWFVSIGHAF